MRSSRGFTLIEVMVTVAIVAILAAVALPSYTGYVMRADAATAMKGLSEMRLKMETYYQDKRTYTLAGDDSCVAGGAAPPPANTATWTFLCSNKSATTYTVTATGVAGTKMDGFVYSIDQADTEGTVAPAASGWPTCATKWMKKQGDTCS